MSAENNSWLLRRLKLAKTEFVESFDCGDCKPEELKCKECLSTKEPEYIYGRIYAQLEADEHTIRIGNVLYQANKSYGKVFAWEIIDIYLENYLGGNKTMVRCSNGTWTNSFFAVDVLEWHKTRESAEKELAEIMNSQNNKER